MNVSLRERLAAAIYRATYGSTPVGTSWETVLEMAELPAGAAGGPFRRIRDHALAAADAAIAELDTMIEELAPAELAKVDTALEDLERSGVIGTASRPMTTTDPWALLAHVELGPPYLARRALEEQTRRLAEARHRFEHALSDLRLTILELVAAGELPALEELVR
jgi:hypothetical protein